MSQVKATFTGGIVAAPERKTVGSSNLLEFPVYINHSKKNKDTNQYEQTGDVTKIKVTLWRDLADNTDKFLLTGLLSDSVLIISITYSGLRVQQLLRGPVEPRRSEPLSDSVW